LHIFKLHITGKNVGTEEFFEYADYYFRSLHKTNQIENKERQFEPIENGLSVILFCPEKNSFETAYSTQYAKQWRAKLETELECNFEFNYIGTDPEYGEAFIPESSDFFILKTGEYSSLLDGDTFDPIPLYKIPFTYDGETYTDINWWERNYIRVEGLWFSGEVGGKWSEDQLQNHDSELSEQGRACAKKIEEVTKVPTYYFLFNYRVGQEADKLRKCPGCGGDWLINGKTSDDLYGFKCDSCRLVSELTSNSE
jgi:predicted  nucleic acid-binding Zn ribbon protein